MLSFARSVLLMQLLAFASALRAQTPDAGVHERDVTQRLLRAGLGECASYAMLRELTEKAGSRLSGSQGAAEAVGLMNMMMERHGFQNVNLEKVTVPHWERGQRENGVVLIPGGETSPLAVAALGGSIGTPKGGITADIIEVKSFEELEKLGTTVHGKIVFFNRPMDPMQLNTFESYRGAVDQRSRGAVEAAKAGGVAALVRSMTLALDDEPHTGGMGYVKGIRKVPAAAVSTRGADMLSALLKEGKSVRVRLTLTCRTLPDGPSANLLGELTGTEKGNEVIVVGGHLDAWDKGRGAHDDGAGCAQALEVLNLLTKIGVKPKRTIRAVLFMNEENGLRGGRAYAADPNRRKEKHVALIESDRGAFAPRGFFVEGDSMLMRKVIRWRPLFDSLDAGRFTTGSAGADISPFIAQGVPGFGLDTENHRYFDYHHSNNDTIDKVNPRELELGAIVEALLCYLISEEGL